MSRMFANVLDPVKNMRHCMHVCVGVLCCTKRISNRRNNILASVSLRTHTHSISLPQWFCVCICICDQRWLLYNSHTCVRKQWAVDVVTSSSLNQVLFDKQYMMSVMLMLISTVMMAMVVLMLVAMCVCNTQWFHVVVTLRMSSSL